jgi:hypothetical protein
MRINFRQPFFDCLPCREDPNVVGVADLVVGVDVDPHGLHRFRLSMSVRIEPFLSAKLRDNVAIFRPIIGAQCSDGSAGNCTVRSGDCS